MKHKILFISFLFNLFANILFAQFIPIDSIRRQDANGVPILLNQTVTVRGVVTTSREFGNMLVYFQDPTGGLVAYDNTFCLAVSRGDSIQVTGVVTQYNGLTELQPVNTHTILLQNVNTVSPIICTPTQIRETGENYEGRLIRINGITMVKNTSGVPVTQWSVTGSGTNYRIFVGSDSCEVRIYATSNIANTLIPPYPFSIVALCSQYDPTPPYLSGYQILPRDLNDLIVTQNGPIINSVPIESNITPTSITLTFTTLYAGDTKVKYFVSDSLYQPIVFTDSVYNASQVTNHTITLTNLKPGKIYYAKILSTNSNGTSTYEPKYFSTASNPQSTGRIEVYFNFPVDTTFAFPGNKANGNTDFKVRLMQRIDSAEKSIDMAIYSFDDLTPIRDKMLNALIRGVKIRVVYDSRNGSIQPLMQDLINAGIRVQQRPIDSYLMHNKFIVFDGRDTALHNKKWVWGGSANITNDQFYNDVQNVILIQDESLAHTYTREFEEMWGSHNDVNNPSLAKFGPAKSDNTPHIFNVNGRRIECYFSPSDDISGKLQNLIINETNKSINFVIFDFTLFTVANKMRTKYNPPTVMVRGVFDRNQNQNNDLYLEMKGIGGSNPWNPAAKVYLDNYAGMLHSKYMLIDADLPSSNPCVETGSANYTNAVQSYNDENILIIYDSLIANQYYQDFVKRLTDAGGSIGIQKISSLIPESHSLYQNYPNPFNPITKIRFNVAYTTNNQKVILSIYDVLGKEIATLVNSELLPGTYEAIFDASKYSSGIYFYRLTIGEFTESKKMMLIK